VPVPAQIGRVAWHDDFVPFAFADLVVATGAAVGLRRLVRMHVANFDVVGCGHGASDDSGGPQHEGGDDHEGHDDDPGVAAVRDMGAKRVVTHPVTVSVG
jgi:hypothetical protein